MWLAFNNMLSGRICDLKDKNIKIAKRQKNEKDLEQEALEE